MEGGKYSSEEKTEKRREYKKGKTESTEGTEYTTPTLCLAVQCINHYGSDKEIPFPIGSYSDWLALILG